MKLADWRESGGYFGVSRKERLTSVILRPTCYRPPTTSLLAGTSMMMMMMMMMMMVMMMLMMLMMLMMMMISQKDLLKKLKKCYRLPTTWDEYDDDDAIGFDFLKRFVKEIQKIVIHRRQKRFVKKSKNSFRLLAPSLPLVGKSKHHTLA